jgi:GNAT superfamily N-acetyltransferase
MSKSNTIRIVTIEPKYAKALEHLQTTCYPTLGAQELMGEQHFLHHCELFPEGDFVALDEDKVVGLGSGFFVDFDFEHPDHTFREMMSEGFYDNHDINGAWYYGTDISVHPDYRGYGIGKLLYAARKDLVRRYNKRGIIAGGVLPGYANHKPNLSIHDYAQKVVSGEIVDSTLTFQLKNGFQYRGLLKDYLEDSASDNWASLIVWENPNYKAD